MYYYPETIEEVEDMFLIGVAQQNAIGIPPTKKVKELENNNTNKKSSLNEILNKMYHK